MSPNMMSHPVLAIFSTSFIRLPTPRAISGWWTFGSLLGACLGVQLITGLFLAMQFKASADLSFGLVLSLIELVNSGWLLRMVHANGASFFFLCLYLHLGRGLYYDSFKKQEIWSIGAVILLMVMAVAFLGYVLPWGQMSFWGATVITSLITAVPIFGTSLTLWLWGGYAVSEPTLTRFFTLHFILPFAIAVLAMLHLFFLHLPGSSSPTPTSVNKLKLGNYFLMKDLIGLLMLSALLGFICLSLPWDLGDPENFIGANPMVAPVHIQPEWYFLFAYAILRSIPNKLGGVLALAASVAILLPLAWMGQQKPQKTNYCPPLQFVFWTLVSVTLLLTWVGAKPVEMPYIFIGQVLSVVYFGLYMVFTPLAWLWDAILES